MYYNSIDKVLYYYLNSYDYNSYNNANIILLTLLLFILNIILIID